MGVFIVRTFALGLALSATVCEAALTLDFSSVIGSQIQFYGTQSRFGITQGTVSSLNPLGDQWWVTSTSGTGAAIGLYGNFTGGPWSYGPITVSGTDEYALVTTPGGGFLVRDAFNILASGSVNWVRVSTSQNFGGVNAAATVNISGMTYTGANPDLIALVNQASGSGSVNLSFQFATPGTLSFLTSGTGPYGTSYSGSMTAVIPEPATLIAGALLLLPFGASTIGILRRRPVL